MTVAGGQDGSPSHLEKVPAENVCVVAEVALSSR